MRNLIFVLLCVLSIGCSSIGYKSEFKSDEVQVLKILAAADIQNSQGLTSYLEYVDRDIVLMPHNHPVVMGKQAYKQHILKGWEGGTTVIKHELIEMTSYTDVVIARGRAVGTFQPKDSEDVFAFETKNMFIFKRNSSGRLSVSQIIFNMEPM